MTVWATEFVQRGMVTVRDALDPAFCEEVVARRLAELGVDEDDPTTWPSGRRNLPATTVHPLAEVAPRAAEVLHELVGGADRIAFSDLPDNLIVNFPDPGARWWPPTEHWAPEAGWHKDGDFFRHFLDSPEQGMLGIVFWRDVTPDQGATYVVTDSIAPVARVLAEAPDGILPADFPTEQIVAQSNRFRALTGAQGSIVWAHPYLVHSASINKTDRVRIISNTTVMLCEPMRFSGDDARSPVEQVVLDALGVNALDFRPTHPRQHVTSERERRWRTDQDQSSG
jgi:Phytanoyl-CoA dioxygenase (PhyH)